MSKIIYWANINDFPDPVKSPEIIHGLCEGRINKILHLKQVNNRKQCLCSGLIQKYIAESHGMSENDIIIDECGKPHLKGVYFNVSHSGDIVVCAVNDCPIGCDIELIKEVKKSVAERAFSSEELYIAKEMSQNESPDTAFFRLWTAKESYLKMTGEGLSVGLKKVKVCLDSSNSSNHLVYRDSLLYPCFLKEHKIADYGDYVVFTCTENSDYNPKIKCFHL